MPGNLKTDETLFSVFSFLMFNFKFTIVSGSKILAN